MNTKRYCYSCDLKDDSKLIEEYKNYHKAENAWPEITKSIRDAGVVDMQIYLTGNRMFMIMEVDETFDPAKKAEMGRQQSKSSRMGKPYVELPTRTAMGKRR